MDLSASIASIKSKRRVLEVRSWIGTDGNRFDELMRLVFNGDDRQRQKASWILAHISDHNPELCEPYLDNMLNVIELEGEHQSVYRSLIRVFTKCELPEELHERINDIMFAVAASTHRSVAERAFAMQVCSRMVGAHPEFSEELLEIIQGIREEDKTPGIRATIRHALRRIESARRGA